jgi:early secretory antigenic target protein ESAT-6
VAAIRVTSEDIRGVSNQLTAGGGEIDARLARLRSVVGALVGGGWQGSAAGAFDGYYREWDAATAQLRRALEGIATQLSSAAQLYEQTEAHLTSQLRG